MKTTKIMKRQMGDYEVLQRTSDSYFDGNALLQQWKHAHPKCKDSIKDFLDQRKVKDFIQYLQDDLRLQAQPQKGDMVETQIIKYDRGNNSSNGRIADKVWMHPYLFIKFALWINTKFEVQVIKFVYDNLISLRCDAGDNYSQLMKRIYGFTDCDFGKVAIAMNWVVFNEHCKQRRDWGTVEQMKELRQLECTLCSMIETGLVNSQMELIEVLRKMYDNKYRKF